MGLFKLFLFFRIVPGTTPQQLRAGEPVLRLFNFGYRGVIYSKDKGQKVSLSTGQEQIEF